MCNRVTKIGLWVVLLGCLLSACASGDMHHERLTHATMLRGFNALQHKNVGWNEPAAKHSFRRMVGLGSNAVVLIAFLDQASSSSTIVRRSSHVTQAQLRAAIGYAHAYGLKVILKPQLLVRDSWAGGVSFEQPQQWQTWFKNYSREIVAFAHFASQQGVDGFVIGTELYKASGHVDWSVLIGQVREAFAGVVTYAAHNVEGVKRFRFWSELDVVSLTLYPTLGTTGTHDEMQSHIIGAVEALRLAVQGIDRPLWVLEIGMPSASGASARPWEWHGLKHADVDLQLQKDALRIWLKTLDKPWVNGVFIWAWFSDGHAGGRHDTDYTPQHKPAERMIRRYWKL